MRGSLHDKAQIARTIRRVGRSDADYGDGATVEISTRILGRAQQTSPNSTLYRLIETGLRDRRLTGIDERHLRIAPGEAEITRYAGAPVVTATFAGIPLASCWEREHAIIRKGMHIRWYYR